MHKKNTLSTFLILAILIQPLSNYQSARATTKDDVLVGAIVTGGVIAIGAFAEWFCRASNAKNVEKILAQKEEELEQKIRALNSNLASSKTGLETIARMYNTLHPEKPSELRGIPSVGLAQTITQPPINASDSIGWLTGIYNYFSEEKHIASHSEKAKQLELLKKNIAQYQELLKTKAPSLETYQLITDLHEKFIELEHKLHEPLHTFLIENASSVSFSLDSANLTELLHAPNPHEPSVAPSQTNRGFKVNESAQLSIHIIETMLMHAKTHDTLPHAATERLFSELIKRCETRIQNVKKQVIHATNINQHFGDALLEKIETYVDAYHYMVLLLQASPAYQRELEQQRKNKAEAERLRLDEEKIKSENRAREIEAQAKADTAQAEKEKAAAEKLKAQAAYKEAQAKAEKDHAQANLTETAEYIARRNNGMGERP